MANNAHLSIVQQGVKVWNAWRKENPKIRPNLSGADLGSMNLRNVNLSGADLRTSNLSGVNFDHAILRKANLLETYASNASFVRANLCDAKLREADLDGTNFTRADLTAADICGATLGAAKLVNANLRQADLTWADLVEADLSGANLSGANLEYSRMVDTNLEQAVLADCYIFGSSAWNLIGNPLTQANLIITRRWNNPQGPIITVDDLEVGQFIYLLLNHKKLRNVLDSVTERGVLILGRFGDGGHEILQVIASKLREMKYLPIIFDFDKPKGRNYTETVNTLVGLSRFVIADLSGPSVPHELYSSVPHYKIPFVPIIEKGRVPYSMFTDMTEYHWVVKPPIEFATEKQLPELVASQIVPIAEDKCRERRKLLATLF
jgi:uncharacterized protein YjbI with pentapeptide repeats